MTLEQKLEKLPAYIYCDNPECDYERHYLTFNRDIQGKWSVGYIEFLHHSAVYAENGFDTLEEAIDAVTRDILVK
jgi:hypothetical protein